MVSHFLTFRSSSQELGNKSGTFNLVNEKIASHYQCSYATPLNGVIKHYPKSRPKLGNAVSKYVYVNNNKETTEVNIAKPVAEPTGLHRGNSTHGNSSVLTTNKFHRSKNNVFRFTASPQPDKVVSISRTKKPPVTAVNKVPHPPIV